MNTVEKINVILKEANISKVNLAKYLGVSRQMVYNYLDGEDLSKLSNDKSQALFSLLNVKNEDELKNIFKKLEINYLIQRKVLLRKMKLLNLLAYVQKNKMPLAILSLY